MQVNLTDQVTKCHKFSNISQKAKRKRWDLAKRPKQMYKNEYNACVAITFEVCKMSSTSKNYKKQKIILSITCPVNTPCK